MNNFAKCICLVMTTPMIMLGLACSKSNPAGPTDGKPDEFTLGTSTTYQVSGSGAVSVKDTVSGTTFMFPNGGSGTLSVAPVISGPDVGIPATQVAVKYTGSEEVAIAVPHTEGYEEIVYIYREIPNASVQGAKPGDKAWLGVPPTEKRADATVFTLSYSTDWAAKRALSRETYEDVAVSKLKLTSEEMNQRTICTVSIKNAIDYWLNNLPPALADSARKKIDGDAKYSIAWSSQGSYYWAPDRTFYIQVDGAQDKRANVHTFAHEAGHYMNHVLVGTERFRDIVNRVVDPENHGFADYFEGRKYVSEDYAFLSDYLITGLIEGIDLTDPNMLSIFVSVGPEVKDFPSFEGYGAVMLGALLRKQPVVISPWTKKGVTVTAPVVGAPVSDVLALVARGARDPNELRSVIQDYLDSRGNEDRFKLSAMMETLGWSYNGKGKIVDLKGNAIQNAHVQSICQTGSGEYRTVPSTSSGADGSFLLPRIYPGTNILRVFINSDKDSLDVPFTADWSKPTNVSLDLGKITVEDVLSTKQLTAQHVTEWKYGEDVIARVTVTATADVTGYGLKSVINPDGQPSNSSIYIGAGLPATVKITASSSIEVVNSGFGSKDDYYTGWTFGKTRYVFSTSNFNNAVTLQESISDNIYTCDFTFKEGDNFSVGVNAFVEDKNEIYDKGKLEETYIGEYYAFGVGFNFYTKSSFSDFSK